MPELNEPLATNNYTGPRRSLILAGGGIRLAYQAGVLEVLHQAGLQFNHVDGTSGGIFNTAMLASGLSPVEMSERWRTLKIRNFMSSLPLKSYFRPMRLAGIGDADGIRKGVFPSLGIDIPKIRNNKDFQATFNLCNFSEKTIESIPGEAISEDLLIAGVSLPIFMPALKIRDAWYTDAVWIKDANLLGAAERGAEEIWLVWAIGNTREYLSGSFNQYVHMIEMSANGGLLEEFRQLNNLNERIKRGESPYGQANPIRLHVIKPQFPLPLDPDLFLNKTDTSSLINMGYSDAVSYLQYSLDSQTGRLHFGDSPQGKIPESGSKNSSTAREGNGTSGNLYPGYSFSGIPFDVMATKMNEPGISLAFRMVFQGTIRIENNESYCRYHLSFNLRNRDGVEILFSHSSLFVKGWQKEIPTFDNHSEILQDQNSVSIRINSFFRKEETLYSIHSLVPVGSYADWRLGLVFKYVKIRLTKTWNKDILFAGEGILTQSTGARLHNLFHTSMFAPEEFHKKRLKHRMMKEITQKKKLQTLNRQGFRTT